mmetsp:Transcript_111775/g.326842  ORF Transcript_111775/g.326842 Transcript_111775/m.326842 type:complete len:220 (+) Transcript_111775:4081-4740(+)
MIAMWALQSGRSCGQSGESSGVVHTTCEDVKWRPRLPLRAQSHSIVGQAFRIGRMGGLIRRSVGVASITVWDVHRRSRRLSHSIARRGLRTGRGAGPARSRTGAAAPTGRAARGQGWTSPSRRTWRLRQILAIASQVPLTSGHVRRDIDAAVCIPRDASRHPLVPTPTTAGIRPMLKGSGPGVASMRASGVMPRIWHRWGKKPLLKQARALEYKEHGLQ